MYWKLESNLEKKYILQVIREQTSLVVIHFFHIRLSIMPILIPKFFSQSLDPEGKGKIGVDQFLSMMEERLVISDWNEKDEERLFIKAFETLDPENTGKIPAAALR